MGKTWRHPSVALAVALALAACSGGTGSVPPVESVIRNESGAEVGRVILRERGERIQVHVRATGLPPGEHGLHLHAVGKCEAPGFQSAGGHLNPTNRRHGHLNPQGPHLGDLGNLFISDNGRGEKTVDLVGAEVRSGIRAFVGPLGIALVIHAARDDETTDPSGNSGSRIACAVLGGGQ
jgi:Cu-Zn family superoxide dismutase